MSKKARRMMAGLGAIAMVAGLAGCGSSAAPPTVEVAYAGSLAYLMDQVVGPHFARATHITYQGRGGGSFAIAQEIKAGSIPANVFLSMGAAPFKVLAGRIPWAVSFATAPLVLTYNPKSRFAPALAAVAAGRVPFRRLFAILETPGFRLGRTNPATDPQGRAFYLMVALAEKLYGLPADTLSRVLGSPDNPRQVFSETGILTELQSGNLDATSAFLPEAVERHLPYVPLPPAINFGSFADAPLYREVSITLPHVGTVTGAPLTVVAAPLRGSGYKLAVRFLTYMLSPRASHFWTENGYTWMTFQYLGPPSAVPAAIRDESP